MGLENISSSMLAIGHRSTCSFDHQSNLEF